MGSRLTLAATAASGMLLAALAAVDLGVGLPHGAIAACAAVATPIALAAGVQRLVYLWRGPPVRPFSPLQSVRCTAADAEAVRAAAQLRGTLGGAGHVYPARLVVHAVACLAAAALGATVLAAPAWHAAAGWSIGLVAGTGAGALLLPARPFYYREAMNGEVAVSPPRACGTLARRPRTAAAPGLAEGAADAARAGVAQE